jgi:hypothetical protein
MPGDDSGFRVHQDWIVKTEFGDTGGDLRHLGI